MMRSRTLTLLVPLLLGGWMAAAGADGTARIVDSGAQGQGVLSVNQAAGIYNQQANLRAIATSGSVSAAANQSQPASGTADGSALLTGQYRSSIEGTSFAGSHGVIGVNQASGVGNQTVNSLTLSLSSGQTESGALSMDDSLLASVQGQSTGTTGGNQASGQFSLQIDDTAFAQAGGVVQVNQVSGIANQVSNTLSLRFAGQ